MKSIHLWIIGIIIAFFAGAFLFGKGSISDLPLFALILICPIMMIFMMGGHKHK